MKDVDSGTCDSEVVNRVEVQRKAKIGDERQRDRETKCCNLHGVQECGVFAQQCAFDDVGCASRADDGYGKSNRGTNFRRTAEGRIDESSMNGEKYGSVGSTLNRIVAAIAYDTIEAVMVIGDLARSWRGAGRP